MGNFKTPGVYVEEMSTLPPSVADVATAVPAFIGFTEKGTAMEPVRISSFMEYEKIFGKAAPLNVTEKQEIQNADYVLYDSVHLFYENGGGVCWILPIRNYDDAITDDCELFKQGIGKLEQLDEVTLILFPDAAMSLNAEDLASVQNAALAHASSMHDRFVLLDIKDDDVDAFRDKISNNADELRFGAAYYPMLKSSYRKDVNLSDILKFKPKLANDEAVQAFLKKNGQAASDGSVVDFIKKMEADSKKKINLESLKAAISNYSEVEASIANRANVIPPSGAIAGVIAKVDGSKGVWAAPANRSLNSIQGTTKHITDAMQENLNVDSYAGKSVNAIRPFIGKGILIWGARTLDGNSNEWRYVSVRRLFNYVEESLKKSTAWAVFSPNDANTWVKLKSQIENFLNNLWREGALAGSSPESAFFVKVGLNVTMDAQDIHEGRLIVEIGLAAVRPAEFVILKFSHKVQE